MTTSPTDTPKRLSDVELENIRVWLADIERRYTLKDSEHHCRALLEHIAALTAPPSQGKVERAREIADAIVDDLTDRKGLRHEWDNIDEDIQEEIRDGWAALITQALTESSGQGTDGAEAMREAAAKTAERYFTSDGDYIADRIRALPLPVSADGSAKP